MPNLNLLKITHRIFGFDKFIEEKKRAQRNQREKKILFRPAPMPVTRESFISKELYYFIRRVSWIT